MDFKSFTQYSQSELKDKIEKTILYLNRYQKILFLTTSNRWSGHKDDIPKSTQLAHHIAEQLNSKVKILEVPKLRIYPCEGNVSSNKGNQCGQNEALLDDKIKNPTGYHRCWASFNNKDDELWKISKELFDSEVVLFFGSVRWGQMNSFYQKLIERLTWIENRHTTLKEENVIKNIKTGLICIGHNWNEEDILKTQKQVLKFFGFDTPDILFWFWRYTNNSELESSQSYKNAISTFQIQSGLSSTEIK